MAKMTMGFGVLLMVLGAAYFFATGSAHPTSLIPAGFGLVLLICGVLANTENAKQRMVWMHVAVTVGLVGFLFPAVRGGMAFAHSADLTAMKRTAATEELIMAVICAVFTGLCVRSFVAARVGRTA